MTFTHFTPLSLLQVHQKQRTACPVCGKRCSDLRQHIRLVHEAHKVSWGGNFMQYSSIVQYYYYSTSVRLARRSSPTWVSTSTRPTGGCGRPSATSAARRSTLRVSSGDTRRISTATEGRYTFLHTYWYGHAHCLIFQATIHEWDNWNI